MALFLASVAGVAALSGCDGCNDPPSGREFDASYLDSGSNCGGAICGDGEVCWRERCTAACGDDSACDLGERCTDDGFCRLEVPTGEGVLCVTDDQCESRLCNSGSCVLPRDCLNDGDCFEDEICDPDGFCVPKCIDDAGCPEGEVCAAGACLASTACTGDEDCPEGACLEGACEVLCDPMATADQCGQDVDCNDAGLCVPHCETDADCAEGFCVHGGCTAEQPDDGGDADADMGADVDEDVLDAGDMTDEDADERIPECLTNEDCGDEETIRCEDGQCVPLEICEADADCFEGQYCLRGQCRPFCATDEECRGEQTCVDQRCVDAPEDAACRSTDDCEPCESCIYGVCTVSEFFCRTDDDCGFDKVCRNGFCAYECATGAECPNGQSCVDLVCLDDPPATTECVFNDECADGFFCINGRCHVQCETHSECGYREMCDHGVCQPDRRPGAECLYNSHCTDEDPTAECVNGYCALPCFEDRDCRTDACELGFCTR